MIVDLENEKHFSAELKKFETKFSVNSLVQLCRQNEEKRLELLRHCQVTSNDRRRVFLHRSSLQDAFSQLSDAVRVHRHFADLLDEFSLWLNETEKIGAPTQFDEFENVLKVSFLSSRDSSLTFVRSFSFGPSKI